MADGRGMAKTEHMASAKEKPAMHVVGDVGGRIAIMVDDMLGILQF